jgi:hypothetical protein
MAPTACAGTTPTTWPPQIQTLAMCLTALSLGAGRHIRSGQPREQPRRTAMHSLIDQHAVCKASWPLALAVRYWHNSPFRQTKTELQISPDELMQAYNLDLYQAGRSRLILHPVSCSGRWAAMATHTRAPRRSLPARWKCECQQLVV